MHSYATHRLGGDGAARVGRQLGGAALDRDVVVNELLITPATPPTPACQHEGEEEIRAVA